MPAQRSQSTIRIGHLAGIPIGIQPLWLLIVAFISYVLGHDYFPAKDAGLSSGAAYVLGLVSALGLFAGILLHELGHAVVARRRGVQVDGIDLWLLGGVSRLHGEARRPQDEFAFAIAGPAVTAGLLVIFGVLRLTLGGELSDWALALLDYQLLVTAMVLGFNLLPAFPLDGGRITRSLLWWRLGDIDRATAIAGQLGRGFGWLFMALGFIAFLGGGVGGLWLVLVGGFLIIAGAGEAQQSRLEHTFGATTVADLMSSPPIVVRNSLPLDLAVERFAEHLYSAFPVVDAMGVAVGILTIDQVRVVAPELRPTTRAQEVASRNAQLFVAPDMQVTQLLAVPAFQHVGRAVVVDGEGAALGVVSITDIQRRLRVDALKPHRQPVAV